MEFKNWAILTFSILSACLILSIPFSSAYMISDVTNPEDTKKISLQEAFQPEVTLLSEIPPLSCDSSGNIEFMLFFSNLLPGFNIAEIKAEIVETNYDRKFDVSSAFTCSPDSSLINNEEVRCRLNANELLSLIPNCPVGQINPDLDLSFTLETEQGNVTASKSVELVLTESGNEPELSINPKITYPPTKLEYNCRTGTEISLPVQVRHAELLSGSPSWSVKFANGGYREDIIACSLSGKGNVEQDARTDLYKCDILLSDKLVTECVPGADVPLEIKMESGDYEANDSVTLKTDDSDLDIHVAIGSIPKTDCQIVDKEGTCIPEDPQKSFEVALSGNVPDNLKIIRKSYTLGGEETLTSCKELPGKRYSCELFVTQDKLPIPENEGETTTRSRLLNVTFETRYINHYVSVSATKSVEMEGEMIIEDVDREGSLKKLQDEFKDYKDSINYIMNTLSFIKWLLCCCSLSNFVDLIRGDLADENYEKTLEDLLKSYTSHLGGGDSLTSQLYSVVITGGVWSVNCIVEAQEAIAQKTMEDLEKFEEDPNYVIPERDYSISAMLDSEEYGACMRKSIWKDFTDNFLCGVVSCFIDCPGMFVLGYQGCVWDCSSTRCIYCNVCIAIALIVVIIDIYTKADIAGYCSKALEILNKVVLVLTVIDGVMVLYYSYQILDALESQIKIEQDNAKKMSIALEDYYDKYGKMTEDLAQSTIVSLNVDSLVNLPTAYLYFNSTRTGDLYVYNESVCGSSTLSISYNFDKMAEDRADFVSSLTIYNSDRPWSRTLLLPGYSGTYGPISFGNLFETADLDPAVPGEYDFIFSYGYGIVSYKLYYQGDCVI